jgi:hypothetical protein
LPLDLVIHDFPVVFEALFNLMPHSEFEMFVDHNVCVFDTEWDTAHRAYFFVLAPLLQTSQTKSVEAAPYHRRSRSVCLIRFVLAVLTMLYRIHVGRVSYHRNGTDLFHADRADVILA